MAKGKLIPKLVIAGAGSGKTTEMVNEIMVVLPGLNKNRVLATITYTNSAAATIRERLTGKTNLTRNIFIGTIHKFLNQFIVIPYATLYDLAGLEKLFLEVDLERIVEKNINIPKTSPKYFLVKNGMRTKILAALLKDGKIPLDSIGTIAARLMQVKEISSVVCNKLQYLFIDEFQDVDTAQFEIFDRIRKGNRTKIYAVGDPEQYIMGFSYVGKKRPAFDKLPINKFSSERIIKNQNYRSYQELVNFTNRFHSEIKQVSMKGSCAYSSVIFLDTPDIKQLVQSYQNLLGQIKYSHPSTHFYLSKENKTFESFMDVGLTPLIANKTAFRTTIEASMELLSCVTGMTVRTIGEKNNLDLFQIRKKCVHLIDAINNGLVGNHENLLVFVINELGLEIDLIDDNTGKELLDLVILMIQSGDNLNNNHQFSSIHKAKGLEADTVLAVAKTNKELKCWLTTDKKERQNDKNDTCRIGYVAFTRAIALLCIGCLEKLNDENRNRLGELSVSIQTQTPKQMSIF